MDKACLFCRIIAGEIPCRNVPIPSPDLAGELFAFEDINPQAPVHVLIIPRRHVRGVNDLTPADSALAGKLVLAAQSIARERGLSERGFRLVLNTNQEAGQTVFHIHLHLLGGRHFTWPPG